MVRQAQTSWCGFSPAFRCACRHHALGWLLPEQLTDRPLFIRPSATRDSRGIIGCVPTRLTPKFRTVQVAPPGLMALLFPISRPSMPCKLEPGIQLRKRTYTDLCGSATPLVPGKSCPVSWGGRDSLWPVNLACRGRNHAIFLTTVGPFNGSES